uniref:NADH-ubiquinone oxidoreductase chain 2 n=1 Tax=Dolomedes angustivirgatus TaxID=492287 RepID=A0A1C8V686_9ARAC|nr:NADH dehydrogenase subunit 2 [Dolomedes angustivirgatus]ANW36379.1 NADH dehydrogenase subunit 2 [Dolomedes angustivirgatus]
MLNVALFMFMYIMSFHLVMNSDDWFMVWFGLEINMMVFIIFMYNYNSMMSIESCLKYFFIQGLGSAIFMSVFYISSEWLSMILCMLLSYKIGAGPFFFWFPSVCSGISWISCYVLMTLQKVIPLMLMSIFMSWVMYLIVIVSLSFGVLGSFNQSDLKQLIAYSSVYHLGWILLCNLSDDIFWLNYLLMYMLMIFPVVNLLSWLNISNLISIMKMKYKKWFIVLMLSMSGMPPFLGFFLKWFAFVSIFKFEFSFMMFLIICSVVMFYVYFRVIYDVLLTFFSEMMWGNLLVFQKNEFYLDLVGSVGLMLGLFFSFFFMM